MNKLLLVPAALSLALLAGCARGVALPPTYEVIYPPASFGNLRIVYKDAAAAKHPTEWNLDGGSWRPVGEQPAVQVGAYTHQVGFRALRKLRDRAPAKVPVVIRKDKRALIQVDYQ